MEQAPPSRFISVHLWLNLFFSAAEELDRFHRDRLIHTNATSRPPQHRPVPVPSLRHWHGPQAIATPTSPRSTAPMCIAFKLAWIYDTGEERQPRINPLIVGRILYAYTQSQSCRPRCRHRQARWKFDPGIRRHATRRAASPTGPMATGAHLCRRHELSLLPRPRHRQAHSLLRRERPHRSAQGLRERLSSTSPSPSPRPASSIKTSSLSAAAIPKPTPRPRATFAPSTSAPASCAGPSTPSLVPANRLRNLAAGRLENCRRRQQLGRHGGRCRARHRLRAHRLRCLRLLRRRPHRRRPLRRYACSPSMPTPASASGIFRACITTSGTATFPRRPRSSPQPRRQNRSRPRADHQAGLSLSSSTASPASPSFPSTSALTRPAPCPAKPPRPPSRCPIAPAPFARQRLTEDMLTDSHSRSPRLGRERIREPTAARASSFP